MTKRYSSVAKYRAIRSLPQRSQTSGDVYERAYMEAQKGIFDTLTSMWENYRTSGDVVNERKFMDRLKYEANEFIRFWEKFVKSVDAFYQTIATSHSAFDSLEKSIETLKEKTPFISQNVPTYNSSIDAYRRQLKSIVPYVDTLPEKMDEIQRSMAKFVNIIGQIKDGQFVPKKFVVQNPNAPQPPKRRS